MLVYPLLSLQNKKKGKGKFQNEAFGRSKRQAPPCDHKRDPDLYKKGKKST